LIKMERALPLHWSLLEHAHAPTQQESHVSQSQTTSESKGSSDTENATILLSGVATISLLLPLLPPPTSQSLYDGDKQGDQNNHDLLMLPQTRTLVVDLWERDFVTGRRLLTRQFAHMPRTRPEYNSNNNDDNDDDDDDKYDPEGNNDNARTLSSLVTKVVIEANAVFHPVQVPSESAKGSSRSSYSFGWWPWWLSWSTWFYSVVAIIVSSYLWDLVRAPPTREHEELEEEASLNQYTLQEQEQWRDYRHNPFDDEDDENEDVDEDDDEEVDDEYTEEDAEDEDEEHAQEDDEDDTEDDTEDDGIERPPAMIRRTPCVNGSTFIAEIERLQWESPHTLPQESVSVPVPQVPDSLSRQSLGATVLAATRGGPHDSELLAVRRRISYGTAGDGHYLATGGSSNKEPEASGEELPARIDYSVVVQTDALVVPFVPSGPMNPVVAGLQMGGSLATGVDESLARRGPLGIALVSNGPNNPVASKEQQQQEFLGGRGDESRTQIGPLAATRTQPLGAPFLAGRGEDLPPQAGPTAVPLVSIGPKKYVSSHQRPEESLADRIEESCSRTTLLSANVDSTGPKKSGLAKKQAGADEGFPAQTGRLAVPFISNGPKPNVAAAVLPEDEFVGDMELVNVHATAAHAKQKPFSDLLVGNDEKPPPVTASAPKRLLQPQDTKGTNAFDEHHAQEQQQVQQQQVCGGVVMSPKRLEFECLGEERDQSTEDDLLCMGQATDSSPVRAHGKESVAVERLIGYGNTDDGYYLATSSFSSKKPGEELPSQIDYSTVVRTDALAVPFVPSGPMNPVVAGLQTGESFATRGYESLARTGPLVVTLVSKGLTNPIASNEQQQQEFLGGRGDESRAQTGSLATTRTQPFAAPFLTGRGEDLPPQAGPIAVHFVSNRPKKPVSSHPQPEESLADRIEESSSRTTLLSINVDSNGPQQSGLTKNQAGTGEALPAQTGLLAVPFVLNGPMKSNIAAVALLAEESVGDMEHVNVHATAAHAKQKPFSDLLAGNDEKRLPVTASAPKRLLQSQNTKGTNAIDEHHSQEQHQAQQQPAQQQQLCGGVGMSPNRLEFECFGEERDQSMEDDLLCQGQATDPSVFSYDSDGCAGAEKQNATGISNEKDIPPQRSKPPLAVVKLPGDSPPVGHPNKSAGISGNAEILSQRSKSPMEAAKLPVDSPPPSVIQPRERVSDCRSLEVVEREHSESEMPLESHRAGMCLTSLDETPNQGNGVPWGLTSDALYHDQDMNPSFSARGSDDSDTDERENFVDFSNEIDIIPKLSKFPAKVAKLPEDCPREPHRNERAGEFHSHEATKDSEKEGPVESPGTGVHLTLLVRPLPKGNNPTGASTSTESKYFQNTKNDRLLGNLVEVDPCGTGQPTRRDVSLPQARTSPKELGCGSTGVSRIASHTGELKETASTPYRESVPAESDESTILLSSLGNPVKEEERFAGDAVVSGIAQHKGQKEKPVYTPHHMEVPGEPDKIVIRLSGLRDSPKEDEDGLRRSRRARVKPLGFYKNERILYGPNSDERAPKDLANMPVAKAIVVGARSPYKNSTRPRTRSHGPGTSENDKAPQLKPTTIATGPGGILDIVEEPSPGQIRGAVLGRDADETDERSRDTDEPSIADLSKTLEVAIPSPIVDQERPTFMGNHDSEEFETDKECRGQIAASTTSLVHAKVSTCAPPGRDEHSAIGEFSIDASARTFDPSKSLQQSHENACPVLLSIPSIAGTNDPKRPPARTASQRAEQRQNDATTTLHRALVHHPQDKEGPSCDFSYVSTLPPDSDCSDFNPESDGAPPGIATGNYSTRETNQRFSTKHANAKAAVAGMTKSEDCYSFGTNVQLPDCSSVLSDREVARRNGLPEERSSRKRRRDNNGDLVHHAELTDDSYLNTKPSAAFPQPAARRVVEEPILPDVAPSSALASAALNLEAPVWRFDGTESVTVRPAKRRKRSIPKTTVRPAVGAVDNNVLAQLVRPVIGAVGNNVPAQFVRPFMGAVGNNVSEQTKQPNRSRRSSESANSILTKPGNKSIRSTGSSIGSKTKAAVTFKKQYRSSAQVVSNTSKNSPLDLTWTSPSSKSGKNRTNLAGLLSAPPPWTHRPATSAPLARRGYGSRGKPKNNTDLVDLVGHDDLGELLKQVD
jgi:hypothetical protein